jgi:hypothetical protein
MFDIFLTDEVVEELDPGVKAVYGKIQIGDFSETFDTSLISWDRVQYERHWSSAIHRILEGHERSALITSFVEPPLSRHLVWWPMYRDGDTVYFQNQLLFFDQLDQPFSAGHFWDFIGQRHQRSDDSQRISEWVLPIMAVEVYLRRNANKS